MIFTAIEHELNDLVVGDIKPFNFFINGYFEFSKINQTRIISKIYDCIMKTDEKNIYTWKTVFKNSVVGYIKNIDDFDKLYFSYLDGFHALYIYKTYQDLENHYFAQGMFSSVDSGCSCDDCAQEKIDIYLYKSKNRNYSLEEIKAQKNVY